jgi:prepilin-type N-terminal cleavage/methylation domain-containing protein
MAFEYGKAGWRARNRGFTLVEIALVVVIASILLIAGMRLMIARAESAQIEVTKRNQDAIKTALISYLGQNNRLPCPDNTLPPLGSEIRNVNALPTPCVNYVGTVPYVTLGLDRSAVLDGWDNFITYVVSPPQPTVPPPPTVTAPQAPWSTSWLLSFTTSGTPNLTFQTIATGPPAFWPTVSTGAITVNDVNGTAISNPAANPPTGAVVVLISYGRNGYGATNVNGTVNSAAGAGLDELTNANPIVLGPTTFVVVNRDITDQNVNGHGSFDDIVLPLRQNDLVAPLVVNGTFQSSPLQTLSQANDYVVGQLASGHVTSALATGACAGCPGSCYPVPANMSLPPTWPVTYVQGQPPAAPVAACIASNSIPTNFAYTLTSQDGNTRSVTNAEAMGVLGRLAGFN